MGNDAQVEITKNSNDRVSESTNEFNVTNRTITILDYKVHVTFYLFFKIKRKYYCIMNLLFPQGLLWSCSLRRICLTALWLPLGALIFCYVTASIFQADDIHETHCRVSYKL